MKKRHDAKVGTSFLASQIDLILRRTLVKLWPANVLKLGVVALLFYFYRNVAWRSFAFGLSYFYRN